MHVMKKLVPQGVICLFLLTMPTLALAGNEKSNLPGAPSAATAIPPMALTALHKSQGIVEVRMKRLDGTVVYRRGSGFLVDAKRGIVVTSIHIMPQFKAIFEDDNAVTFYRVDQNRTVQKVPAYAYATSGNHELTIFQLDGAIPSGMDEVAFAKEAPEQSPVYARLPGIPGAEPGAAYAGRWEESDFRGRIVHVMPTHDTPSVETTPNNDYIYLDPPVEFFGEMVVNADGRVVGMGNGIKQGHTVLTSAHAINKVLAEARQAEQGILNRGGLTPQDLHTINKLSRVFAQIMRLHITHALERPSNLWDCAYEMFSMEPSGACRDPFSSFLPPERARKHAQSFEGSFGGVQLEMQSRENQVVVVTTFLDTPAARAGIQPGDVITTVDGSKVESVGETLELLQGRPGTPVVLTIWRQNESGLFENLQFTLRREIVAVRTVKWQVRQTEGAALFGIIRIDEMRQNTADQFRQALENLAAQNVAKIVIDVRDNPGGSFNAVVRMLALFMEADDTALVRRAKNAEQIFNVGFLTAEHGIQEYGTYRDLDIVVLINGGSASAAEIFAGAMQDWGYTVVGERSFGKGVAQSPLTLHDDSMFLLSTFEFLVGNHHVQIRDRGVQPNIEVRNQRPARDEQLVRAIDLLLAGGQKNIARQ